MTTSPFETGPPAPHRTDLLSGEADLWERLRESMERLRAVEHQQSDPEALARKLAARARLYAERKTTAESGEARLEFLGFTKGPERYGIPLGDVLEVQALEHFTPLPKAPPFLPGVIHSRGSILALLDLGRLCEAPQAGLVDAHVCLIVEAAGRRIALVASDVEGIFSVRAGTLGTVPELPGKVPPEWFVGVHESNRLILRMDSILQDARLIEWRHN